MLTDDLLTAVNEPIQAPPIFRVGQTVRVLKRIIDDGQTPHYWSGAKGECISVNIAGLIRKVWVYQVRHPNGNMCEFKEEELDYRFRK